MDVPVDIQLEVDTAREVELRRGHRGAGRDGRRIGEGSGHVRRAVEGLPPDGPGVQQLHGRLRGAVREVALQGRRPVCEARQRRGQVAARQLDAAGTQILDRRDIREESGGRQFVEVVPAGHRVHLRLQGLQGAGDRRQVPVEGVDAECCLEIRDGDVTIGIRRDAGDLLNGAGMG